MKFGVVFRLILRWDALRTKVNHRRFQSTGLSRERNVKIKDLNSALKPFLFMVHPDLFGNFPKQRNVNEDSLKQLNSFLQTPIGKRRLENEKLSLKFFLRDPNDPEFDSTTEISVNLCGTSRRLNEVDKILKSAGLPGVYSTSRKRNIWPTWQGKALQHRINKKRTKYDCSTIPRETFFTFLERKAPLARKRVASTSKLRKQVRMLNEKISLDFGFKSLCVDCNWRIIFIHGFLKNLYALLDRHRNKVQRAAGWKVTLGTWSGVDSQGVINLNIEDEPLAWIWLLSSVECYSTMLSDVKNLQCAISQMLGGLTITNVECCNENALNYLHLQEFRASLRDLYLNLNSTAGTNKVNLHLDSYKGTITGSVKKASVLPSGSFLIPLSMNGFDIVSFLTTSIAEARHAKEMYKRELLKEEQITDLCIKHLGLCSLTRCTSLNHFEMISCCENLLNIANTLTKSLVVKVGQAYHMSADGELTIPWNWKECER